MRIAELPRETRTSISLWRALWSWGLKMSCEIVHHFSGQLIPKSGCSMAKNIFLTSSFLWSNLCPLPLVLSLCIMNMWQPWKRCPLSSLWLPLKCWKTTVRSYWAFSSTCWTNPVPSTFFHTLSLNLWPSWWPSTGPSPISQCLGDKNWTKVSSRVEWPRPFTCWVHRGRRDTTVPSRVSKEEDFIMTKLFRFWGVCLGF